MARCEIRKDIQSILSNRQKMTFPNMNSNIENHKMIQHNLLSVEYQSCTVILLFSFSPKSNRNCYADLMMKCYLHSIINCSFLIKFPVDFRHYTAFVGLYFDVGVFIVWFCYQTGRAVPRFSFYAPLCSFRWCDEQWDCLQLRSWKTHSSRLFYSKISNPTVWSQWRSKNDAIMTARCQEQSYLTSA